MYLEFFITMNLKQAISVNLKHLRESTKLSQEAFAKKCGMHQRAYGRLENGENWQHLESLHKIAVANDLNVWQLLIPNLDISNPPLLSTESAIQKEFYDKIKAAALGLSKLP